MKITHKRAAPAFDETTRFGSAAWATEKEVRAAGLFAPAGPQIGYLSDRALYLAGDAPMLTIGGAGSGKLRDLLAYVVCGGAHGGAGVHGAAAMLLDPRGELAAISMASFAAKREPVYCWNPTAALGLPQHACNPLDILTLTSRQLHADTKFIAESLIPLSGGGEAKYFEMRARDWCDALIKTVLETEGAVSLPALYRLISRIESDPGAWADALERMLASQFENVRRTAGEMLAKQQDAPKEFGAILGELYGHLGFLDDPMLLAALERCAFSLGDLVTGAPAPKVFLNIPAAYLSLWSPLIRLFFTVAMLYKGRRPDAGRLLLVVDEAGQLGRFEALLRAFTFGRGEGVRAWAIFQDIGQIKRNFGAEALASFMGSAQLRQFFGVRDPETAKLVSEMLGTQTLRYTDTYEKGSAGERKRLVAEKVIKGADPFGPAYAYDQHARTGRRLHTVARKLLTPEEVLALPEDQQILFVSGKNLRPIRAQKFPYFDRPEMAGRFLPNPYHPPTTHVRVRTRRGVRVLPVVVEPAPVGVADLPQYASGVWSTVRGYRPGTWRRAQTARLDPRALARRGGAAFVAALRRLGAALFTEIRSLIDGP